MNRRRILAFIACLLATCLLTVGWRLFDESAVVAQSNTTILVSAAASLKDVLEEIKPLYQQGKQNVNINYNFGASGALLQQIENGAPADIFISAGKKQINTLNQKGMLVADTQRNLATNRIVLIVPSNSTGITSFPQLTEPSVKRIAIGEPRSVPAGQYAEEVFKNLGILDKVKPKFVLANNVRQVLAAVESGNADAGMVYITDAKISRKVKVALTAEDKLHSAIAYPMAVLKSSKNIQVAREFIEFLSGSQAKAVLQKYGFGVNSV